MAKGLVVGVGGIRGLQRGEEGKKFAQPRGREGALSSIRTLPRVSGIVEVVILLQNCEQIPGLLDI